MECSGMLKADCMFLRSYLIITQTKQTGQLR